VIRAIPGPNAMDVEFDSPVAGALPCHVREGAGG
jgi:hypothetical protein